MTLSLKGLAPNQLGALWMVGSGVGFALTSALAKLLSEEGLDPFQISLSRAVFSFGALLPFLLRGGLKAFATKHPKLHFWRSLGASISMLLGFYAVAHLPLATVTAISFTTPIFATVLAVFMLREVVRWRRWSAIIMGFVGMLVIVRPGAESFDPYALASVSAAILVSFTATLVKRFPAGESQAVMLFYFCVTSVVVSAIPALSVWQPPTGRQWLILAVIGLVGVGAHALFLLAYRLGEASVVAPFDYFKLLIAVGLGYFMFGEIPDLWTWVGAGIIIVSTLYIAQREASRRAAARGKPPPPPITPPAA